MGWRTRQPGFTIVELLIVIVVIGILAAIVIVAYNGIQNQAYDTTVESDVSTVAKKLELFKAKEGTYPIDDIELEESQIKVSQDSYEVISPTTGLPRNNLYYRVDNKGRWYALGVISKSGERYYLRNGQVEQGASGVSWAGAGDEVIEMADNDGVEITTADLSGSSGHSGSSGWEEWTK